MTNNETYELMEERIITNLQTIGQLDIGSPEREALMKETAIIIEKYNESDRVSVETADKDERREIERQKVNDAREIEMAKLDVPKKRMWLEILKIAAPVATAVGSWVLYDRSQKRGLKFEETGTYTSTTVRDTMHLPKILK